MAKRTAKKKAADDESSRTSEGRGTTTPLRSLLTIGNRTSPSQTHWSSRPSRKPRFGTDGESLSTSSGGPTTLVRIFLPTGETLDLNAADVTLEITRDFIDATTKFSPHKTYITGGRDFIIKGKL